MHGMTMARTMSGCAIAMLALACGNAAASIQYDEAIREVALDYAEGWLAGDEQRVARALHPEMLKRRVVIDILSDEQVVQVMDAQAVLRATREGQGRSAVEGPMSLRVSILDRHGDIAVVRVVSALYVHYLNLVRWEDRWVILSVLWGTMAAPGD